MQEPISAFDSEGSPTPPPFSFSILLSFSFSILPFFPLRNKPRNARNCVGLWLVGRWTDGALPDWLLLR
jgi:hypothetical protein